MLKSVLVALDGSQLSAQIIQSLKQLQLTPSTTVVLSHVISSNGREADPMADRPHPNSQELLYQDLERQFEQADLNCKSEIEIVAGDPADEIVRLANIHQADLIVIGNRGLTGFDRVVQGSVSSQVVENAPCSVLVVKSR